jgi:NAD(P)H-flavin reductase
MTVAQKLRCQVARIVDHGEQVYTVELRPERPAPRFRPGQILHLALDEYDPSSFWPESRVFSIANAPAQRDLLRISYSVRGRFTARMAAELVEGGQVWIKLPYGEFVVHDTRDVALFAGGTGVTAFTAFIAGLTSEFPHSASLFYGARRTDLLIYRPLCDEGAGRVPQFQPHYFVEEPDLVQNQGDVVKIGRLSMAAAWPMLRDPLATDFYLSGPPIMLKAFSAELRGRGVTPLSIKMDAWE